MLPRKLIAAALLVLMSASLAGLDYKPLPRDPNLAADAVVVVKAKNIVELIDKVSLVADMVQPGTGMIAKTQIAAGLLQNPMLEGLDAAKPSAFLLSTPEAGEPRFAIVMAASNGQSLLSAMLANMGGGNDIGGVVKIDDNAYAAVSGPNVVVASTESYAREMQANLARAPILGQAVASDLEILFDVKGLVKRYRPEIEQAIQQLRTEIMNGLDNAGAGGGPFAMVGLLLMQLRPFVDFVDEVLPLIDQFEGLTANIDIDTKNGEIKAVWGVYSAENSTLSELIAAQTEADNLGARDLAAAIPGSDVVMLCAFNAEKTKEILARVASRLSAKYQAATQTPDPMVVFLLEKWLDLLPQARSCATGTSFGASDQGLLTVQAMKPGPDLMQARSMAATVAGLYKTSPLMAMMKDFAAQAPGQVPVVQEIDVVDVPEIGGFQVQTQYGELGPELQAVMEKTSGNPAGAYIFQKAGLQYSVSGYKSREKATAIASGSVPDPLVNSALYRQMFTKTPPGYRAAGAIKLLHLASAVMALNPQPMLQGVQEGLKPFLSGDTPVLFYITPVGTSTEYEVRVPISAVSNIAQASMAMMMRQMGGQQPGEAPQEEGGVGDDELGF